MMLFGQRREAAKLFILTLAHRVGDKGITVDFIRQKLQEKFNEKPIFSISMILNNFMNAGYLESSREEQEEKYMITPQGKAHRIILLKQSEKDANDKRDGPRGGAMTPVR